MSPGLLLLPCGTASVSRRRQFMELSLASCPGGLATMLVPIVIYYRTRVHESDFLMLSYKSRSKF
eukprot:scaffold95911_cov36-Prasinocladus_malaysianus.AAC.2